MARQRIELKVGPLRTRLAEYIRCARRNSELPWTVEGFAEWIGCVKQSIYNHDKRVTDHEKIAPRIEKVRGRWTRIQEGSSALRDSPARKGSAEHAKRLERLEADVKMWRDRYHNTIEKMILLEEIVRSHGIDVDPAYELGIRPPDRSVSKAGSSRRGNLKRAPQPVRRR